MVKTIDPYRLLFPIGTAYAFFGVLVWLLFPTVPGFPYPGPTHSRMMLGGFLFSYVLGFLMTAIPKMTASHRATPFELGSAAFLVLLTGTLSFLAHSAGFMGALFAGFVFLIAFCLRRFIHRTKKAPDFFVFIGSGLAAGTVGALMVCLSSVEVLPPEWTRTGQLFLYQVMVLSLVLGIGCRLIPVISGLAPLDTVSAAGSARLRLGFLVGAALLWISVLLEMHGPSTAMAYGLRAFVCTSVALFAWKLFARPKSKSRLAYLIKAAALMVPIGFWMAALQPAFALHWMHLTYIGGFGLMTFTVASRVTLAHGGYDLAFEARSRSLLWLGGLLLFAALTRAAAPFIPNGYSSHLRYAALVWLAGVSIWSWVYVRKMIAPDAPEKSSC